MREEVGIRSEESALVWTLGGIALYVGLGALCFSTAYVETNTAAVWIPSGYAVGLLAARGLGRWPAIALGSFVLNLAINLKSGLNPAGSLAVAVAVAFGNTMEGLFGAYVARRFAAGPDLLSRPRHVAIFASSVVLLAPLLSAGIGVPASRLGGIVASDSFAEVMLTWYVANAVGILIFAGPFILVSRRPPLWPAIAANRWTEALLLALCLVFTSQAICGFYFNESLRGWPKIYMIVPLLIWASFRFGTWGALSATLVVTAVSVVGTMRGFEAFPAPSSSRALIYLQVFLGFVTVMTLLIAAGLAENLDLRVTLEERVRARTHEIELHMRDKEVFTTLVAHDLQSPVFGLRNALGAASEGMRAGRLEPADLAAALVVMEETCVTLAARVASLLTAGAFDTVTSARAQRLDAILAKIASAHRLRMDGKGAMLHVVGDTTIAVQAADKVEHILDILVDNAIKFSPAGKPVEIAACLHADRFEINVTDGGCGVAAADVPHLFEPRSTAPRIDGTAGAGLGLYLAREQAVSLGGDLTYAPAAPQGSRFRLVLPA